ncbi:hypothetical protein AKJ09_10189 [Labilithrix luteola]|uniref:DUF1109 domain-containing protein n=1 Tax=Labilithrix luteola TaxID=1391654 RepID=A0A0K1QCL8_9BACT|nr:NrsF family protein [Labilithrix luteola]AKV03526.1 hypothetical protein AKJ09_10189 [Labilithrix luteola]
MSHERASSEDLRARVMAEAARSPSPTRAQHRRRSLVSTFLALVAIVGVFFLTGGGIVPGNRPAQLIAFSSGIALFVSMALTMFASVRGSRSMLGPSTRSLYLVCVLTAPLLGVAALLAASMWPSVSAVPATGKSDMSCAALTLVQGIAPLLALIVPRRGTDPVHPAVTGAALGTTAGAWAAAMAYLRCTHPSPFHGMLAHIAPVFVLALLGAVLGARMLRVRR